MPESDEALLRRAAKTAAARKSTAMTNPQWLVIPEIHRPNRPENVLGEPALTAPVGDALLGEPALTAPVGDDPEEEK